MASSVQLLARDLLERCERSDDAAELQSRFRAFADEFDRLNPRDFPAAAQFRFIDLRRAVRTFAQPGDRNFWDLVQVGLAERARKGRYAARGDTSLQEELVENLVRCSRQAVELLNSYGGSAGRVEPRPFAFIADPKLRDSVERDYQELSLILLIGHAWKSAVVMAGGILEAVLYDQLTRDPARVAAAMSARQAPRKGRGAAVRDIAVNEGEDEWPLSHLTAVSEELGLLPPSHAGTVASALGGYRNLVRPSRMLWDRRPCTEAEAAAAKSALDAVCHDLGEAAVTPRAERQ